jgi:hypothetical protein
LAKIVACTPLARSAESTRSCCAERPKSTVKATAAKVIETSAVSEK